MRRTRRGGNKLARNAFSRKLSSFEQWLPSQYSAATSKMYTSWVTNFVEFAENAGLAEGNSIIDDDETRSLTVVNFLNDQVDSRGLKPATLQGMLTAIQHFYYFIGGGDLSVAIDKESNTAVDTIEYEETDEEDDDGDDDSEDEGVANNVAERSSRFEFAELEAPESDDLSFWDNVPPSIRNLYHEASAAADVGLNAAAALVFVRCFAEVLTWRRAVIGSVPLPEGARLAITSLRLAETQTLNIERTHVVEMLPSQLLNHLEMLQDLVKESINTMDKHPQSPSLK